MSHKLRCLQIFTLFDLLSTNGPNCPFKSVLNLFDLLLRADLFNCKGSHQWEGGDQSEDSSHGFEPGGVARQQGQVIVQRETQSHNNYEGSLCDIVPAEQCQPGQKWRHHTVAQVHPVRLSRTTGRDGKPPTGTSKEGDYRGSVDHLSICQFRVKGLCCSHQEGSRQERDEPRETKVQSWFGSLAEGSQTEPPFAVSSLRGASWIPVAETWGRPAHGPGAHQPVGGSYSGWH